MHSLCTGDALFFPAVFTFALTAETKGRRQEQKEQKGRSATLYEYGVLVHAKQTRKERVELLAGKYDLLLQPSIANAGEGAWSQGATAGDCSYSYMSMKPRQDKKEHDGKRRTMDDRLLKMTSERERELLSACLCWPGGLG